MVIIIDILSSEDHMPDVSTGSALLIIWLNIPKAKIDQLESIKLL